MLLLTNACNQRCRHCLRDARVKPVSRADISALSTAIGSFKQEHPTARVVISGGEPTLVPNLCDLIAVLYNHQLPLSLCTNATLIADTYARELAANGLRKATVGFEGVRSGYDLFRGSRMFSKAIAGVHALSKAGVAVTINVTLHDGIIGAAPDFAEVFNALDIVSVCITSPIIQGRMQALDARHITADETNQFARELSGLLDVPVDLRVPLCSSSSCPAGISVFMIDHRGILWPCPDKGSINVVELTRNGPINTPLCA